MSNRVEIESRIEEIKGDLNAMNQGWMEFDPTLARVLRQELQHWQERLTEIDEAAAPKAITHDDSPTFFVDGKCNMALVRGLAQKIQNATPEEPNGG